jgi:transcriptional regulator with XRE-family HTH domain
MNDSRQYTKEDERALLKIFGRNLKGQRLKKGLTQEHLGELANVNYKYIGEIERGEKNPSAIILYKLSKALGVSVEEIIAEF